MCVYDKVREETCDDLISALFSVHREKIDEVDVMDFVEDIGEAAAIVSHSALVLQSARESWSHDDIRERIERVKKHFSEMLDKVADGEI